MNKIKNFPFYINYYDVDQYCFLLIDLFGENAECVKLIDDNYTHRIDNPKCNADVLLLEIRQFLADNGFKTEVEACDKQFSNEERMKRGMKNPYIAMHERWKKD